MNHQLFTYLHTMFPRLDARVKRTTTQIIEAFILERSVNIRKLALHCPLVSKRIDAAEKRIHRYMKNLTLSQTELANVIMLGAPAKVILVMDRTNWESGGKVINILCLSVVLGNTAVPLYWKLLDHKGNSSVEDRRELVQNFIEQWGVDRIDCYLGDREFFGTQWCTYLEKQGITFHIRIKGNITIGRAKGELLCPTPQNIVLEPLEKRHLASKRKITNDDEAIRAYVSVCRSVENELVIVVSNNNQEESLEKYAIRWTIETLFGCLKTRGFNLEDTHLLHKERISNLFMVLTLTYFWAFKVGEWLNDAVPIKFKRHKSHNRLAISIFRYGLDALIRLARTKWLQKLLVPLLSKAPKKPTKSLLARVGLA